MSALLFRLRNVPKDEANDIYELLNKNHIEVYETSAGNWGISMPAIWVADDSQLDFARQLISDYQCQRTVVMRSEYESRQAAGLEPSLRERLLQRPIRSIAVLVFSLFIVYYMLRPIYQLIAFSR